VPSWSLGVLDPRDDDVTVDLPINTLSRILKVTQFNKNVGVVCEPRLPVRLMARLGPHGSQVDVYIQQALSGEAVTRR
jgi:hypothetical protein